MPFFRRDIEEILKKFSKFPVVALLGPRQSGKTTLAQYTFKDYEYLNLDDFELLNLIKSDPKGVLRKYENDYGIIIDEFQNFPDLLSYIKVIVDEKKRPGYFILTGSQNFLMNEAITQSLAGRVGILTLLPLSLHELEKNDLIKSEYPEETIFKGGYPRVYLKDFQAQEVYPSYIQTYLERDVRQLINVVNLSTFQRFIKLCAARIGQLLNYSDLATSCGISVPTVHQWLSVLEASYIVFLLRPHWTNFNKRVTKTPKIYFYDTGLACSLLEVESEKSLVLNSFYGNLFENLIIADIYKQYFNQGLNVPCYFWRDKNGDIEVDCLIAKDSSFVPIEIKSGETFNPQFFNSLIRWSKLAEQPERTNYVVYGGKKSFSGVHGNLMTWLEAGNLLKKIKSD